MRKLLFLCTANYYRSRFAEMLFNHLAAQHHLNWHADSRGIATILGADNTDVISEHTINGLQNRGVGIGNSHRAPIQVQAQDFEQADQVIALDEQEHRPYMQRWFPEWAGRIEYWQVGDLHITAADEALQMAEAEVRALIQRLTGRPLLVAPVQEPLRRVHIHPVDGIKSEADFVERIRPIISSIAGKR